MSNPRCLDPETMADFVAGRLRGEALRVAIIHLDRCSTCYEKMVWLSELEEQETSLADSTPAYQATKEASPRGLSEDGSTPGAGNPNTTSSAKVGPHGDGSPLQGPSTSMGGVIGAPDGTASVQPNRFPLSSFAIAATLAFASIGAYLWFGHFSRLDTLSRTGMQLVEQIRILDQEASSSCETPLALFRGRFEPSELLLREQVECRGDAMPSAASMAAIDESLSQLITLAEEDAGASTSDLTAAVSILAHPGVRSYNRALILAEKALNRRRTPDLESLYLRVLFLAAGEGQIQIKADSIAKLETLRNEHPDNPIIAYNLARMLTDLGETDRAKVAWVHFLELDSASVWAEEARWAQQQMENAPP